MTQLFPTSVVGSLPRPDYVTRESPTTTSCQSSMA